ncbi:MAG: hypothetical protein ACP5OO_03965 [Chloroflexia bacterium]
MWDERALSSLIAGHLARHRAMAPCDVYKLLYQGVLGPEHLVASADFDDRLRAEYAALPAEANEPLWEEVRPDGELGRINLRPFKARGGDLERLLAACRKTAGQIWGTVEELREVWARFVEQCQSGLWEEFPLPEVRALAAWLEEQGYPAVHHSPAYRAANRPAYRLLARAFWPERTE